VERSAVGWVVGVGGLVVLAALLGGGWLFYSVEEVPTDGPVAAGTASGPSDDGEAPKGRRRKRKADAEAPKAADGAAAPAEIHDQPIPGVEGRVAPPAGAPNVVLVFGCTVRRDQITPYGGPESTTPYLDRFARSGVLFTDAVGSSTWTLESSAAVITGLPALSLGLPDPEPGVDRRALPPEAVTLAERLVARGYAAVGVTANPNLNEEFGLAQGFDRYRDTAGKAFSPQGRAWGDDVVAAALALVDGARAETDRPLYVRATFIDAHLPRGVLPEDLAAVADASVPPAVVEYRAALRRLDRALQRLDEGLQARGLTPENTVYVFVADHGEGLDFPAHHRDGHGMTTFPSVAEISWIVRGPNIPAAGRVDGLASHEDLVPTVLGLAGLGAAEGSTGSDWSALVKAGSGVTSRQTAFTSSWFHGANIAAAWTSGRQCQVDYGSVRDAKGQQVSGCYDRKSDPALTTPIEAPELLAELEGWRQARLAEFEKWPGVVVGARDDTEQQLEVLGYAE
jgi:arylsulfatase A-like enzyme